MTKWPLVKLGDVCDILDNKRIPITASKRISGIYPYYGANGVQDYINDYIFDDDLVLVAEDGGHFGSKTKPIAYKVSGKCWVNNHAHVLKPKDSIDIQYLTYSLMFYDVSYLITGSTRPKLTLKSLKCIQISLPPISIQQRIAAELDHLNNLIDKRKQQLQLLDQLIKAKFLEMFGNPVTNPMGWRVDALGNCSISRLGKMLDAKKQNGNNPYTYLANTNVQWFYFKLENLRVMDFDQEDRIEFELQNGDLLVCEGGEIGRCAVWENNLAHCFFQKALHRVRCNPTILSPYYLSYVLYFKAKYTQFKDIVGSHATIPHLTGEKIKQMHIPLPPLEMQQKFLTLLNAIKKTIGLTRQSLSELELLYNKKKNHFFSDKFN